MPADKHLIECPSCYATKGQYHKPGCSALTPPADPAAVPPPEDDDAEDARAIRDALSDPYRVTFDEVVEKLSDKQPPPEWAMKMVAAVGEDYAEELERLRQRGEPYEIGTNGLWYQMHARLLASVREGALREAAVVALSEMRMDIRNAILALLHTPPSGGGGASVADELFRGAPEGEGDPV